MKIPYGSEPSGSLHLTDEAPQALCISEMRLSEWDGSKNFSNYYKRKSVRSVGEKKGFSLGFAAPILKSKIVTYLWFELINNINGLQEL